MRNKAFILLMSVLIFTSSLAASSTLAAEKVQIVHYVAGHGTPYYQFLLERKEVFEKMNPDVVFGKIGIINMAM